MYGYIYKFTNKINGKIYIGKHKYDKPTLDENYLCSGILINAALKKYGKENFDHSNVECFDTLDELNEAEKYYINYFNCKSPNGYNLTDGGDGISNPSEEIIEKNRQAHLGKKQSEDTKLKRAESLKNVKRTKEWCAKISASNKGQVIADSTRLASSKRHKNTKWYNDGIREYMLFDGDPLIDNLKLGRLKNPFPEQCGIKKSKELVEKMRESKKNKLWFNNGTSERMFLAELVPEGFIKGRLKKNKPQ